MLNLVQDLAVVEVLYRDSPLSPEGAFELVSRKALAAGECLGIKMKTPAASASRLRL